MHAKWSLSRPFYLVGIARLRDKIALPLATGADFMDLNYLYQRYAISLQMAEDAACVSSRLVHRKMAEGYAARIEYAKIHGTLVPA